MTPPREVWNIRVETFGGMGVGTCGRNIECAMRGTEMKTI